MIQYSFRFAARFAILLPGIIITYFSVRDIFPYFHRRLPLSFAILVTYALGAYVLAPAIIRVIRIVRPAKHIPVYCITPDGFASDPLNIGILATRRQLITAMEQAGWHVADPHTFRYVVRHIACTIFGWPYKRAPMSNLYLFGRKQDIAFEIQLAGGRGNRHHVRFWATTYADKRPLSFQSIHWHHRRSHIQSDNLLWVGAASLDIGMALIRHNLQITHMIDPDTNQERELIVQQLHDQNMVKQVETVDLGKPYRLINRAWSGYLQTDGNMAIVSLRKKTSATSRSS
ncbi:MAG TPA: LssY C-terminal domain-containing protein [Verrucomicrobiae bacterium]|jgi:hypothetical protein|nr:LssY C-terminal domain-containing protein [Verrucomicrobiae bacterium]